MAACFLVTVEAADSQGNTNQLLNSIEAVVTARTDTNPVDGSPTETYYVLNGTNVRTLIYTGLAAGVPAAVRSTTKRLTALYRHAEYGGAGAPATHAAMLTDLKNYSAQAAGDGVAHFRPGQTVPVMSGAALLALFKSADQVVFP